MNAARHPSDPSTRDDRDELLDRAIDVLKSEPVPQASRQRVMENALQPEALSRSAPEIAPRRTWSGLLFAAAAVVVVGVIGFLALPSASIGWSAVQEALQSQEWIRAQATLSDGTQRTHWLSPNKQIWASQGDDSRRFDTFLFYDGNQRAKYEYRVGEAEILKLSMTEDDVRRLLPAGELSVLAPWLAGGEKIVEGKRREVTEEGRQWIEFEIQMHRGEMNLGVLRIDPDTNLPVSLVFSAPDNPEKSVRWRFDYPASGPTDVYALGIPAETKINDQSLSGPAEQVLDAIAASRSRIGDFELLIADPTGMRTYIVSRKGDRWRIDSCRPGPRGARRTEPAEDQTWDDWLKERMTQWDRVPMYICDGQTVYKNESRPGEPARWQRDPQVAPHDLLSGERNAALVAATDVQFAAIWLPDLSPRRFYATFEFDPAPADDPEYVLIKRSARIASKVPMVAHEWYYLDPQKGHALARAELFTLPADAPADPDATQHRQTIRLEDFQKSPQEFWYPTVMHDSVPFQAPQNLNGEPLTRHETTFRYRFDFDAELPDALFTIKDAQETAP